MNKECTKIKINILSATRFHVLDLARELSRQGYDVKFYSLLPKCKCAEFGLSRKCCASLFLLCCPMELFSRFLTKVFKRTFYFRKKFQDWLTSLVMRKSDITIAMSGQYIKALRKAKSNGSIVILERGSKHILEQKRILDEIPGAGHVSEIDVRREIEGYELADYVSIPASHVKESFLKYGYDVNKLFVNPYGADLSMFYSIDCIEKKYDLIMVGTWCYRKGCDRIVETIKNTDFSFLHVGSMGDMEFPRCNNMYHIDTVSQKDLVKYYNQARVMILPSREEGFALVLLQALACGLPIVCSKDSGGRDLEDLVGKLADVIMLDDISNESIRNGIEKGLKLASKGLKLEGRSIITWERYGERYGEFIDKVLE